MNTKQIVFNKIAKIKQELSAEQKIELATPVADFADKAKRAYDSNKDLAQNALNNAADKMFKARKEISAIAKELGNEYNRTKKMADELGVDIESTTVGKNFRAASDSIEHWSNRAEAIQKELERIKI